MPTINFSSVDCNEWNHYISQIPSATYMHRYEMINYYTHTKNDSKNLSYIITDNFGVPLYAVILGRDKTSDSFSLGSALPPLPIINTNKYKLYRDTMHKIFYELYSEQSTTIKFIQHPACINRKDTLFAIENMFFPLNEGYIPLIINSSFIDLREPETTLFNNMGKYQRKHINKSLRTGLSIKVYSNLDAPPSTIDEKMDDFRRLHLLVAGRETRPRTSWSIMADICKQGNGAIFIAEMGNRPVSYLFCGSFNNFAFGWSQVNNPEYEKELSPRHLLEWHAIQYYKNKGLHYYEVGAIHKYPQLLSSFTQKEISIGVFKERYGGTLYPLVIWEKFHSFSELKSLADDYCSNYMNMLTANPADGVS